MATDERRSHEEAEAEKYAAAIRGPLRGDWSEVNADIIHRFSRTALLRIKRRAWQLVEDKA